VSCCIRYKKWTNGIFIIFSFLFYFFRKGTLYRYVKDTSPSQEELENVHLGRTVLPIGL
jgi:hypothetical protein